MASGVPVVAVRAGGIPDILTKQGQTGYLYAPGGQGGGGVGACKHSQLPAYCMHGCHMLHSYSLLAAALAPLPLCLLSLAAGDVEEAAAQVSQLVANPELRARVGAAGREEVALWDWRAATQHLLNYQYPLAMAAAAQYYGRTMGRAAEAAGYAGGGGGGGSPATPAMAA